MGCFQSTQSTEETEKKGPYSWETREKVDPKDYTIENLKGETVGRTPGTVKGQQFIIQDCEDCNIYIFDHSAQITVDDCINCRVFLGPVKGSVFIRDCKDCKFMLACQQFRTRDCKKIDIFLSCVSQPIIENSTGMKFGCFQCYYTELEEQFRNAQLSVYNNNWCNIHDFTPVPGEENFSLLPHDSKLEDFIPAPTTEHFANVDYSTELSKSVVPRTAGSRRKTSDESCLVVFFNDGTSHDKSKSFIEEMKEHHTGCVLVQSKDITLQPSDAQRIFGTNSYATAVGQGAVIGFEYNGDSCCKACEETLVFISKGSTGLVFVSSNPTVAAQQIEQFYNFADMQMNA